MTERDFAYWLRGYFELVNPETIPADQVKVIKEHLDKLFTPSITLSNQSFPLKEQITPNTTYVTC